MGTLDYVRDANQIQTNIKKPTQFTANKGRYFGSKEDEEENVDKPKKKSMLLTKNKVNNKPFNKIKPAAKQRQEENNVKPKGKPINKAKNPAKEVEEETNEKPNNKVKKNPFKNQEETSEKPNNKVNKNPFKKANSTVNALKTEKSKFKTNKVMKKVVKKLK